MSFRPEPLLLLLCLCGLSMSDEDILAPGPLEALVGSTATFRSLLKNPNFMVITWNFNDGTDMHSVSTLTRDVQNVDERFTGRANISADGTLTLTGLTEADSGDYSITIVDSLAATQTAEIALKVIVPVSDVKITANVPEARELNTTVVLTCSAKGSFLSFSWFNNTVPVTAEGTRVTIKHAEDSSTLSFSSVYRADLVGPLFCEASNSLSKNRSDPFSLKVHYGPERVSISPEVPPRFLASKMNFSLSCSSSSSPGASYAWFFEDREISTGPVLSLKEIEDKGFGKRPGNYVCKAHNDKTELTVPSPPVSFTVLEVISGVQMSSPSEKLVAGNSSANISCVAASGSVPMVHWEKDGAPLKPSGRVVISSHGTTVSIKPLQKEDNGEYLCKVSNPVSNKEERTTLTVFYGPEAVVLSGDTEVEVTDPVKLTCSSSSLPAATFSWTFNGTKLSGATSGLYAIESAAYANTGLYTCEASNSETGLRASKSHFLSVKEEGALDEGLSDGAIAGIVIGVIAALGLAIGLFLYCRQKVPLESPY